jgi:pyruvate/2-oxoglutarate dehydrogenase complex dihydrolipoamide acyltransferase (E2) component
MAVEFKLPDLGENIESGDVVNVLVAVGDTLTEEQPVIELETDKAVIEVPCPHAGTVQAVHVKAGDTVAVGQAILTVEGAADAAAAPAAAAAEPAAGVAPASAAGSTTTRNRTRRSSFRNPAAVPRGPSAAREGSSSYPRSWSSARIFTATSLKPGRRSPAPLSVTRHASP